MKPLFILLALYHRTDFLRCVSAMLCLLVIASGSGTSYVLANESQTRKVVTPPGPGVIEEIVVSAPFVPLQLNRLPGSISVIGEEQIRQRSATHLQDVLNKAVNVNFAAGASRGRFVQLRGIGERSQFVDPVNPSVGLVIDDMDVSGLGGAATLLDVEQVEILRGPQGTRFGANALAGLINIRTRQPGDSVQGYSEAGWGRYDTWHVGGAIGGPLSDSLTARVAWRQDRSDGYVDNDFVGRDDTNNIDEDTLRLKARWRVNETMTLNFASLYLKADNGYDGFSLDNTRRTLSDQPGHDRQETAAGVLKAEWWGLETAKLEAIVSHSSSNLEYGFDEDWSYNGLCTGTPCEGWEYSSTDNYQRDKSFRRVEVRALSSEAGRLFGQTDWVLGWYYSEEDSKLNRQFTDWDLWLPGAVFYSDYDARNTAVYGELSQPLSERLNLTVGGRLEHFKASYKDDQSVTAKPDENLWGGQISFEYLFDDNTLLYALFSRGYKAGGINGEALGRAEKIALPEPVLDFLTQRLEYDTETLINWELGIKASYLENTFQTRLALFYMDRRDIQLKAWYNNGPSFIGYTDNASDGKNYGLEWENTWQITEQVELFANVGWLDTEIDEFVVNDSDCACLMNKSGREQAHAPRYQFSLGGQFELQNNWFVRVEVEGKDEFYFSNSHDQKSSRFELLHATVGYLGAHWEVLFWGRNLSDEDYQVRGFYFGNDPRKFYANEPYYQFGEPRVFGANVRYHF